MEYREKIEWIDWKDKDGKNRYDKIWNHIYFKGYRWIITIIGWLIEFIIDDESITLHKGSIEQGKYVRIENNFDLGYFGEVDQNLKRMDVFGTNIFIRWYKEEAATREVEVWFSG